jgi:hypothetical protein
VVTLTHCARVSGADRARVRIGHVIRRLLVLCVSLACCLALSSCNSNRDPKTVDGFPAYVTTNDEKGAQNFARYWISTLNQATTSGRTAKFKSLNKDSCDVCTDFAKQLDTIYGAGGHVETDGFKVKKIANEAGIPKPGAGVSVVLTATPQKVVKSKGAAARSLKGGDLRLRLIMVRDKSHWVMDRVDVG